MSMQEIDKALIETEKRQRIKFIIANLNKSGIYKSTDGRYLNHLAYKELEDLYIEHRIRVAKEIGKRLEG